MIEPLLARLHSRIIVVTGKGGVGKTTAAGALAVAFADRGHSVHLISTDPAHSLADLFESNDRHACSDNVTIEEFDARAYADALFARMAPALTTLIERGTYLDAEDAASFLDLSMPGIDEVMGALRIVDLLRSDTDKIVVDTAPTGHTLRLLESPRILRSWVAAARAMADKARAVAEQLMRQSVRFAAEDMLDEIDQDASAFEQLVLRDGAFVIATRAGSVIQAETTRLIASLKTLGVDVASIVTDERFAGDTHVVPIPTPIPIHTVPHLEHASGCAALRAWAARLGEKPAPPSTRTLTASTGNAAVWIGATPVKLIWIAGKGGVGKSTCAAAIATLLSETKRVCLVSTDPAGSLSDVLRANVSSEGTSIGERMMARQIDATAEFARMRERYHQSVERVFASLGLDQAARLDRRVVDSLFDFAPPGIDEIISLIEIIDRAPDFDVTVIDSAPTGHFLRLLEMPEIALQWVHALLRILLKYHAVASLDSLGQDLLGFSKQLRQLKLDLSEPGTTEVFVATRAEPMIVAETVRLFAALRSARIPVAAVIFNQADEGRAHAMRSNFPSTKIIHAPDAGGEVLGSSALRAFLAQWELIGE
jgi:arsenite/tail-anchored protein-transporting ATPase